YDTLRVERGSEAGSPAIPVPAPTRPLGIEPVPAVLMADTSAAATSAPAGGAPSTGTTAPATSSEGSAPNASSPMEPAAAATSAPATGKGPCWRVQVAAPVERAEADSRLQAAQSLLVVPMAIVVEKGFFKVRTLECLTRE